MPIRQFITVITKIMEHPSDLCEVICQKLNIFTNAVGKLVQLTRERLAAGGHVGKLIEYGFSRGELSIDCQKSYLTPDELKRIFVVTFGSAKMVSREHFADAVNYVSLIELNLGLVIHGVLLKASLVMILSLYS